MKDNYLFFLMLGISGVAMFMGRKIRTPEENRILYSPAFESAAEQSGVPADLLERVAQQESAFRSDIISGQVVSSAGAKGIMQIVPRWHPDVNPLDPVEAIHYAAGYLKRLYSKYGDWASALQAYNWGPGNLDKYLVGDIQEMPTETKNYYTQILSDVNV